MSLIFAHRGWYRRGQEYPGVPPGVVLEDDFYNLFDVRNVHNVNGKFVENVVRDEMTMKLTDKLTAKAWYLPEDAQDRGRIDPYIYDGTTGEFFTNRLFLTGRPIDQDRFARLNYEFFDWLSLNGIYERTNDYTLAYGNFPQNILRDDTSLYGRYYQYGNYYSYVAPFLYGQGIFPQAPYEFYNVFKSGLRSFP
jgi:hypothetical protein